VNTGKLQIEWTMLKPEGRLHKNMTKITRKIANKMVR